MVHRALTEFYSKDPSAKVADLGIIAGILMPTIQNPKHKERFKNYIAEIAEADASVPNVSEFVLAAKRTELAGKVAVSMANRDGNEDKLIKEYMEIQQATSLDTTLNDDVVIIDSSNIHQLMDEYLSNENGLQLYPKALNDRLKGRLSKGHHVTTFAPPEMGKCLAVGTPVLMADGTVRPVEQVQVGEYVMGVAGPRTVLHTARGTSLMYKVTYGWGDSYIVNKDHVLSLKVSRTAGKLSNGQIVNVSIKDYLQWSDCKKGNHKGWKSGVDFPERVLPMDPYLFGLWIGDGSTNKTQITTTDPEILAAYVQAYGPPSRVEKGITYSFGNTAMIRELLATGAFRSKNISMEYLTSSRQQRLELLAGLIDSDGYKEPKDNGYSIVTISDLLKDNYLFLARSLGLHATAKRVFKRATNAKHKGALYWNVYIGAEAYEHVPVRLARKKGKQHDKPKRSGLHFGIKVELVGDGEYAGFSLDGDHLFMLGDFTVTHNSAFNVTAAAGFCIQGRKGIYCLNEDRNEDMYFRLVSCLSGMSFDEVMQDRKKAIDIAMQRGLGNLTLIGMAPGNVSMINGFVDKYDPEWVVVDQMINLNEKGDGLTQILGRAAKGLRTLGKSANVLMLTTSQAADSASGKSILDIGDCYMSNVEVPAQADLMIGIGANRDQIDRNERTLSLCKNKVSGDHSPINVRIIPQLSRYTGLN